MMQRIDVTIRFMPDGRIFPREFSLDGEMIKVRDVGRGWESEDGRHLLVMDGSRRTYHLFFQLEDLGWYLIRDQKDTPTKI